MSHSVAIRVGSHSLETDLLQIFHFHPKNPVVTLFKADGLLDPRVGFPELAAVPPISFPLSASPPRIAQLAESEVAFFVGAENSIAVSSHNSLC